MAPLRALIGIIADFPVNRNDRLHPRVWRSAENHNSVVEVSETIMSRKMSDIAARNRRAIVDAKLSRRDMMKLGLLTAAGTLALKSGLSARANGGNDTPISPPTR